MMKPNDNSVLFVRVCAVLKIHVSCLYSVLHDRFQTLYLYVYRDYRVSMTACSNCFSTLPDPILTSIWC